MNDVVAPDPVGAHGASKDDAAVVIGSVDWQDATSLPDGSAARANSRAVAYLDLPSEGARCTAFLIAPDVVMTNRHCIPDASAAAGARAMFRYETGGDESAFDCSTFLGNDATLDYALLQCAGRPGDTYGVVELSATEMARSASIYVIHQNCDYYADPSCSPTKKYSPGRITHTAQETDNGDVAHDADTLGGSSGSPVFSSVTHTVVALHHVGIGGDGSGRGSENRAVPMTSIVPTLRARFPGLALGGRAPVEQASPPTSQTPPPATSGDGYEPNDTLHGATAVQLPFTSVDARIDANGDVDHFSFAGASSVRIDFHHADGDLDLYVVDGDGNEVARSIGTSDFEEVSGPFNGIVIARVVGYRGATGSYTMTVR